MEKLTGLLLALLFSFSVVANDVPASALQVMAMEYPPYTSAELPGNGHSFQALNKALTGSQWAIEPLFYPPARAATWLANHDNWLLSIFPPASMDGVELIALPGERFPFSFFRLKQPGEFKWNNLSELAGRSVIMTRTPGSAKNLDGYRNAGLELIFVNNIEQGMKMLSNKLADYLLTTLATGQYYAHQLDIPLQDIEFAETIIRWFPYTIYLNHDHPQAQAIRKVLIPKN